MKNIQTHHFYFVDFKSLVETRPKNAVIIDTNNLNHQSFGFYQFSSTLTSVMSKNAQKNIANGLNLNDA